MPDTIRLSSVTPISVSIAAIADQTTLDPATLDSTVSGGTAPHTYAWTVNGATTGIAAAANADTTFTPTTAGRMAVALTVTDSLGVTGSASRSFLVGTSALSVSIVAVSDQLDLDAITLDSTATGGVGSKTYAWTINGATTGLSDATAADPTFTPTGGGEYVAVCTVTDAAGQTATASVSFTVGKYVASIDRWVTLRASIDFTTEATASWLAAGATPTTRTIQGYDFVSYGANRAVEFGLVNGAGVRVYHNASFSNRLTAPGLYIEVQDLVPGWSVGDPLVVQLQHDVADLSDGAGFVALTLGSTVPTTNAAGTYFAFTGYERTATAVHKAFVDHNDGSSGTSSGTSTLAGAAHGQELIYDGLGARFGMFLTDPAGAVQDPGSSTGVSVRAADAADLGPVAWIRRTPGSTKIDSAACTIGLLHHGNNTGLKRHIEHLWVWA